jgi:hypothetical protein
MNEYGAQVENGSWKKAEAFGEKPTEYRHCPPQIPPGMSLNFTVCAKANHLSYSAAHDKKLLLRKTAITAFQNHIQVF